MDHGSFPGMAFAIAEPKNNLIPDCFGPGNYYDTLSFQILSQ